METISGAIDVRPKRAGTLSLLTDSGCGHACVKLSMTSIMISLYSRACFAISSLAFRKST